jgi:Zn-dependent peptidase ImmA (M78 family)
LSSSHLDARTAQDIDSRVAKILSDLGNPPPPLQLSDVRELLHLDRGYYSSSDDGLLREVVHRLTLAGKQVIRQPRRLLEVVRKMDLKALWVPEQKQILLDSDLPSAKQRWAEGHEIGHGIIPWHQVVMHGDQARTLSPGCAWMIEEEANYTAARLLFLRTDFQNRLGSGTFELARVRELAKLYGNSITSTLWRAVEESEAPAFALVSQHPKDALAERPLKHYVRSRAFAERFPGVSAMRVFETATCYCRTAKGGPLGQEEVAFDAVDKTSHVFRLETFYNRYEALTLGVHLAERTGLVVPMSTIRAQRSG